jgi:hypothetical protein
MPNYQDGKVYTIRCRTDNSLIYVGSTTMTLSRRLSYHRGRGKKCTTKFYLNVNNDWDNWYIELYENHPCNSKEELCKREGEVIREIGTLNSKISGRSQEEWSKEYNARPDIIEKYKEWRKEYNDKPEVKDRRKEWYDEYKVKPEVKEREKERNKQYQEENVEKVKAIKKAYREANKEKIAEYRAKYWIEKKK